MSEAELPAAHGVSVSLRNDAPEVRNDGLAASETGDLARADLARAPSREAPEGELPQLAPTVPSPPSRLRPSPAGDRSFIGVACSLAAHAIIVTALLVQAPWEGSSLMQDDDEISVELVDAMPEAAPSPEQATSVEPAQPTPSSEPTEVDRNAVPVPPPAESEAAPLPLPVPEPTPTPAEAQPPAPPAPVPPAENEAQPQPSLPQPPETVPKEPSPAEPIVPRTEPSRNVPSAADIAARERAERLEREKREEAAKAARERAARATEAAKRQEEQRQEARQQAQAKAAQASAAKAAQTRRRLPRHCGEGRRSLRGLGLSGARDRPSRGLQALSAGSTSARRARQPCRLLLDRRLRARHQRFVDARQRRSRHRCRDRGDGAQSLTLPCSSSRCTACLHGRGQFPPSVAGAPGEPCLPDPSAADGRSSCYRS